MLRTKILISSIGLPSQSIGSWVVRIQKFQENLNYFDYILSPTSKEDQSLLFCRKNDLKIWQKLYPKNTKTNLRAEQYLFALKKIAEKGNPMQVLVMDDRSLLDSVVLFKPQLPKGSEICFSYHGHSLALPNWVMDNTDKVFFLTIAGYKKSLEINYQFTPQTFIVGNGVVGDQFFPLSKQEKGIQRESLGYSPDDRILVWMANSRPVKGFHLFKKIAVKLLEKYPDLKIISIGHETDPTIHHQNWKQAGRLAHKDLPGYLQIGDIYFFTSLWQEGFGLSLAEAVKSGNWVLSSALGGIPEVLQGCRKAVFVEEPNIVNSWIQGFESLLEKKQADTFPDQEYFNWLKTWHEYSDWEQRYFKALID
ncbi:MAG: glycosyltransferase family 4 protein [Algoriphagus sp.]|nr:glycosyltransferase family 4 protein [Algoriphagus sp.]